MTVEMSCIYFETETLPYKTCKTLVVQLLKLTYDMEEVAKASCGE